VEGDRSGDFPQWDLGVQLFDQETADKLPFDHLDATKLIPEEVVPVRIVGTLTLNRNVDNFFANTEQVAFCTQNVPPGSTSRTIRCFTAATSRTSIRS
jgi:catalase